MMHKCGHDDCFSCPFKDCIVNGVEANEFIEVTGKRGRPKLDPEEKKRRKREFQKKYYKEHREEIMKKMKERYREKKAAV